MIQVDFVDLPIDAQIEDLRSKLEQEQRLGDFETCPFLCDDGSVCGSRNHITTENVEFVDSSDLEPIVIPNNPFAE
jgi:hypothetical protein